ncbi:MAG TPA: CUAEP/CCAEP-tail radical SAM protein, partial [Thermomicrobiales bacterium]|nr:CUAEP/CCAEP-tail radical SAM protein [Thermomicrobiales bacterium]
FFGLYATLNADFLLGRCADSVISGEYEAPLLALVEALDRGAPAETVPLVGTRTRPAPPALAPAPEPLRLVPPARDGLPALRSYAGLERDGVIVPVGYVETTRGCHHECRHCPIPPIYGGRFVVTPREVVLADARAQIAAGARHLTFGDPDFFNGPGHGLRIARALRTEFPFLTFDATIKIEHLLQHRARLPELAELGCAFVVSAVESVNPTVLAKLAKGHTPADVETALASLDAVGVPMRPSLMPFSPWETLASYLDLLRFVVRHDLIECIDPVHYSIRLLVPPGSLLLADPAHGAWLGELDAANFTYRWRHPDPRMDDLQAAVGRIAEDATASGEPAATTFGRIWAAAHAAAGEPAPPAAAPGRRPRPPRLTESWFC